MKNILWVALLSFISVNVYALDYKEVDIDDLLISHPLFSKYDNETGRFKDTKSEILSLEEVEHRKQAVTDKLNSLKENKSSLSSNSDLLGAFSSSNDENWNKIAEIDKEIAVLETEEKYYESLKNNEGIPGDSTVYNVVSQIASETINPIKKANPNSVIFAKNKHSIYDLNYEKLQEANGKYYEALFNKKTAKTELLIDYMSYAPYISYLFPSTENNLIYTRKGNKK